MTSSRTQESWRGASFVLLSLLGLALCVCAAALFSLAGRLPRQLDRFVLTRVGEAALYRVTYAGGHTGFLTVNVVNPTSDGLSYAAVYGGGGRALQVNYHFTNWQGTGQPYTRVDFFARHDNRLLLLAQHDPESPTLLDPPVEAWSARLLQSSVDDPHAGQTTIAGQPLAYRLWRAGAVDYYSPSGSLLAAELIQAEWRLNDSLVSQVEQWVVSGLGLVRHVELDAAGQPTLTLDLLAGTRLDRSAAAPLPLADLLPASTAPAAHFREGLARTGAVPGAALAGPDLRIVYRRQSGTSVTASPAFAGGTHFLADQDGRLVALDAYTAVPRWQFTAGGPIVAAPAVADGIVYVGAGDKTFYALTAHDGHYLWHRRLLDNIASSALVADGMVYVGAEDRTLYALDARTGTRRWSFVAGDRLVSSPALAAGRVIFGAGDGLLYALDARSGDLLWRHALDSAIEATPAISNQGVVFAASSGQQLAAINAATGSSLWSAQTRFGYLASPAVGPTLVYVADVGGGVHAFSAASGALAWEWFEPGDVGFVSSPLLVGGHLLAVTLGGQLYVWDAATGEVLHTLKVGDSMTASPTWTGDAVLLANGAGDLIAVQGGPLARGLTLSPLWNRDYAGRGEQLDAYTPLADPILVDDRLYALLRGGRLVAIDPATGLGIDVAHLNREVWATPAERAGRLYTAALDGRLTALDLVSGAPVWQTALDGTLRFGPALDEQRVYIHALDSPQTVVSALDAATGDLVWQRGFSDGVSTPALAAGHLLVAGPALTALDPATGDVRWESEPLVAVGALAAFDGVVYAGDADGRGASFLAVDAATGATLWRRDDAARYRYGRPAFDTGTHTILAGTQEGVLNAFDAATGELRWRFQADAALQSEPRVRAGVVFCTPISGSLFAIDTATGRLLDHFRPGTNVLTQAAPLLGPDRLFTVHGATLHALALDFTPAP